MAEILYKEALTRSNVTGTNFNYILISKPVQEQSGIEARILEKKTRKEINVLIGNKKILKNRNIYVN